MTKPLYFYNGSTFEQVGPITPQSPIAYQTSAPTGPATGDLWIDSDGDVDTYNRQLTRYYFVATASQTTITGVDANGLTLAYVAGSEAVYVNGALQVRGQDYTATDGTSVVMSSGLAVNDVVEIFAYTAFTVANTYTQAQSDARFTAQSGSVLQVVQGVTNTTVSNTTGTPALTGLNATITPKYGNSKLLFTYCVNGIYVSTSVLGMYIGLRTGNTANAGTLLIASAVSQGYDNADNVTSHSMSYLYTPPSLMSGAQTFSVQFHIGQGSGTVFCQSSNPTSTLIIQEIGA
jgi:hypothetical protein